MDFVQIATKYRKVVEEELAKLFTPDGIITDAGIPADLAEPLKYSFMTGGKRLRPVLCLAACQAVSGKFDKAVPAALAIEALHTYTLIHDDLPCMDNDLLRRGRPTVHAKYGYAQGVLAGDALQAVAFALALKTPGDAEAVRAVTTELARAAGPAGVIGGQWVDVCSEPPHDRARIEYVHEHKTSDLIQCALVMGAGAAGASDSQIKAFREFGRNLGIAFQIVDDILDADDPAKADEMGIMLIMDKCAARCLASEYTAKALAGLDAFATDDNDKNEALSVLRSLVEGQVSRKI